jgi:hypothetical protein
MRNPPLLISAQVPRCEKAGQENAAVSQITLRDLAAIAAMQAMLASPSPYAKSKAELGRYSAECADALLAALEMAP